MRTAAPFPYRLAAIDIDDTLIGPDKVASSLNLAGVRRLQARGVRVILATGRSFRNMMPYCSVLGLCDFMVDTFGAQVRHSTTDEVLQRITIPPADAAGAINEGLRRGYSVMAFVTEGVLAHGSPRWLEICRAIGGAEDPVYWTDFAGPARDDVERVVWLADHDDLSAPGDAFIEGARERMTVIHTLTFALEFLAPAVNKAMGVAAVAAHYGIGPAEVLAFGDGRQDLPMLTWAGLGVAMPHGAAATGNVKVAPPGDPETALARAIEEILS